MDNGKISGWTFLSAMLLIFSMIVALIGSFWVIQTVTGPFKGPNRELCEDHGMQYLDNAITNGFCIKDLGNDTVEKYNIIEFDGRLVLERKG